MSTLYLSRARLRDNMNALGPILFPNDPAQKIAISHRLVWTLFPQELKERCFLYRESASTTGPAARSEFMVLSTREPADRLGLFDLQTREFAPKLAVGQHLRFSLRANPTAQLNRLGLMLALLLRLYLCCNLDPNPSYPNLCVCQFFPGLFY